MKIKLALEWFINPDHLPFIVGLDRGLYKKNNIELEIIEPEGHYDGFKELAVNNIQLATNEPLHLIEKYQKNICSIGNFFETNGGIIFTMKGYENLINGNEVKITSPVSNPVTDKIANDIIQRHLKKINKINNKIKIIANDFYHIKHLKAGFDAAWLCFENFEGVESKLEGLKVKKMYLENVQIPNFCALDIFASKSFAKNNENLINEFKFMTEESIKILSSDLDYSKNSYYAYTKTKPSILMDNIIKDTIHRFKNPFVNSKDKWRNLHQYVVTQKISDISNSQYEDMFI
ncbi:MAG: hydroxymethylpyrimidine ABC transporter substrate-binding protein [Candidatus Marinimicrobia bacterium]|nr:hydroxymethylpyrimidine ABC transporter substrate-binding protein [Candidatus Neomarinimicrobiota bacterium]|tara:strand:+ start:25 stop:894 length:870 start_codon:yes stop_codon:yes gene_type:complete